MKFSVFSLLKRLQNTYILSKNIEIAKNNFSFMFTTRENSYWFLVYQEISTTRNFRTQSPTKSLLTLYHPCIKIKYFISAFIKTKNLFLPIPSWLNFLQRKPIFLMQKNAYLSITLLCDCMSAIYGVRKK